ncbi:MAG: amino acid adenylation domain-containing protein [Blastocatellia bacterium]
MKSYLDEARKGLSDSYTYQDFPVFALWEHILKRSGQISNVLVRCPAIHRQMQADGSYDLVVDITLDPSLLLIFRGKAAKFSRPFLEGLARHVRNLLAQYLDIDRLLSEVSPIDEEERERLLTFAAGPSSGNGQPLSRQRTIAEIFQERAAGWPENIAIRRGERETTYRELNGASNRLARFLVGHLGIKPGDVVGLFSDRSGLSIIGLLAILKSGGVYLPLEPSYPMERLRFIVEDANARALLINSRQISDLMELGDVPMFALDIQMKTLETSAEDPEPLAYTKQPAYIIYTSGSTGRPKGTVLEHAGFVNMVLHHIDALEVGPDDRLSQFYAASFDSSLFEIFVALISGAALVLVSKETINDPEQFADYIESQGVTMLTVPPIYLRRLDKRRLGTVRKIVSAGDHARPAEAVEWARSVAYYNSYGPTEASVCVTHYRVNPDTSFGSCVPVGRPISNTSIHLLDSDLRLVPQGCIGEICIGGVSLAREYLNLKEATERAFVRDPFTAEGRLYRTGDLGVWLPDGNLELVGRNDNQVKIRGYRVELGEVEAALLTHRSVDEAVVVARETESGEKRLAGYVTLVSQVLPADLRGFLIERLPEYMVPSAFIILDRMPVTENGKIDRKALPAALPADDADEHQPPQNAVQEKLVEIWKETLNRQSVGVNDNFFGLGGDSILLIQMASLAAKCGLKLSPHMVFEHQTIAALSQVVEAAKGIAAEQETVIGLVGLLPMQAWFFLQNIEARHHFNQSVMIDVPAGLNPESLQKALGDVLLHHDALRARFALRGGKWEQRFIDHGLDTPFDIVDLPNINGGNRGRITEIERHAGELQAGLDLVQGPLIRVRLFRLDGERDRLLFVVHHLSVDGVSWRILLEDFYTAYHKRLSGEQLALPRKTTSVREWERCLTQYGRGLEKECEYWLHELQSPHASIPFDYPGGDNTMGSSAEETAVLSGPETESLLREALRPYNVRIEDLLLTALALTLKGWTAQNSVLVDIESNGREDLSADVDLSRTVGWLTSVFPARLTVEDTDLGENLKAVKEQFRRAPHRGIGYGVLRFLGAEKHRAMVSGLPGPEVVFNYLGQADRLLSIGGEWFAVSGPNGGERASAGARTHLLEVGAIILGGQLRVTWSYSRGLHKKETIQRRAQYFLDVLRSLISHCRNSDVSGYTPSDFPGARIDQVTLDSLRSRVGQPSPRPASAPSTPIDSGPATSLHTEQ